jgi:hypothetical protein
MGHPGRSRAAGGTQPAPPRYPGYRPKRRHPADAGPPRPRARQHPAAYDADPLPEPTRSVTPFRPSAHRGLGGADAVK